jgi:hypothetical protein
MVDRPAIAGAHTASICRHTPEVGAVCGQAARTDLCEGRRAISVPTAKLNDGRCVSALGWVNTRRAAQSRDGN